MYSKTFAPGYDEIGQVERTCLKYNSQVNVHRVAIPLMSQNSPSRTHEQHSLSREFHITSPSALSFFIPPSATALSSHRSQLNLLSHLPQELRPQGSQHYEDPRALHLRRPGPPYHHRARSRQFRIKARQMPPPRRNQVLPQRQRGSDLRQWRLAEELQVSISAVLRNRLRTLHRTIDDC